jgi:hypothetical protein
MAQHQVRRLPVVQYGKLVGVLTLADIAREVRSKAASSAFWSLTRIDASSVANGLSEKNPLASL